LAQIFEKCSGQVALLYSVMHQLDLHALRMPFVFQAGPLWSADLDCVFSPEEWPLPVDFFDLILIHQPLEQAWEVGPFIVEAKKSLRADGVLLITGRNRAILKILSALDQAGFSCKVQRFHVCAWRGLNEFFEKWLPFLSRGFVIEARVDAISMTPLQEQKMSLMLEKILHAQPALVNQLRHEGQDER
jgi:SAM-dependent methyltransferase